MIGGGGGLAGGTYGSVVGGRGKKGEAGNGMSEMEREFEKLAKGLGWDGVWYANERRGRKTPKGNRDGDGNGNGNGFDWLEKKRKERRKEVMSMYM